MPARQFITLDGAAAKMQCSKRHLRRLVSSGQLPAYRVGINRMIRIDVADLDKIITPVVPRGKM